MLLPFVLGVVQFGIVVWFHLSVSDSNSCASSACELVLNCLILIHFTYVCSGAETQNRRAFPRSCCVAFLPANHAGRFGVRGGV